MYYLQVKNNDHYKSENYLYFELNTIELWTPNGCDSDENKGLLAFVKPGVIKENCIKKKL